MKLVVRAPGKAFLCGEYAVLRGAPAVVMAVARYARATYDPASMTSPDVHTGDLYDHGRKLGLGSSAAWLVAAEGARRAAGGANLADARVRDELLRYCVVTHAARQGGRGSGADVAAGIYGGICEVRVVDRRQPPVVIPTRLPGLQARLFWTGRPASTAELVARVLSAPVPASLWQSLTDEAWSFADACQAGDAARAVAATLAYCNHLRALGEASEVPVVGHEVAQLMAAVQAVGGAAKPSGAGAGDLLVALLPAGAAVTEIDRAARSLGLEPLADLAVDTAGVAIDSQPEGTAG